MSGSDALINLLILLAVMAPLSLFSWWVIRRTPVAGLSGAEKWWRYRIRIGAGSLILLTIGLALYFMLNLITAQ